MLAKSYEVGCVDPTGYWASEKLDGVRSVFMRGEFYSRTGKVLRAPDWFVACMPKGVVLDGELYTRRNDFQRIMSIVTKHIPVDEEWREIVFMAFDVPHLHSQVWEERLVELTRIVDQAQSKHLKLVSQVRLDNAEHLEDMMREFQRMKCEGIMLRSPNSPYEFRRSAHLLKYKRFLDAEAVVVGHQLGKGKYAGVLGKLVVRWKDVHTNVQFHVGTGFNDTQRKEYQTLFPIDTIVKIKFFQLNTSTHKPRFPVFLGIRHPHDVLK